MRTGFTLVETMIATALSILLILIIFLSTVTINRVGFQLQKKYDIALSSKNLLERLSREVVKNNPPVGGRNPIISVNNNFIEFYSVEINNNVVNPMIVNLSVSSNPINNGFNYLVTKTEMNMDRSVRDQRRWNFFIPSQVSEFKICNLQNVIVRIYLRNEFNLRNQRYELYYKVDIPVNIP